MSEKPFASLVDVQDATAMHVVDVDDVGRMSIERCEEMLRSP